MTKNLLFTIFAFCCLTLGYSQADCASAVALTPGVTQSGDTTGNGAGSFNDAGGADANPCSANYNDLEYWFEYTAVATGETLDLTASNISNTWYGLFVLDNCPDSAPTCVGSATNNGSSADLVVSTGSLTAGTTYYVVFTDYIQGTATFDLDVTVNAPPTCLTATNLSAVPLSGDTTATLSWDAEAGATLGYNWAVMTSGEDPAVDTPVSMGSTTVGVTTDTATGLTAGSTYDFYVQSNCDANGLSTWAGPVSFLSTFPPSSDCGAYSSSPGAAVTTGTPVDDIITVAGTGGAILTDLNVTIKLDHTYLADIELTLTSPTGTAVEIMFDQCGANVNMDIAFDDEGVALVCGAPTVGTFIPPTALLDGFDGEVFDGNWTLNVTDDAGGDDGTLITWCLTPTLAAPPPANDECAAAIGLTLATPMAFDNTGGTDSGVDSCFTGDVRDLWYSFVAPASGEITIAVTGAAVEFALFSDCTTEVSCGTAANTGLTAAATYYVSVTDDGTTVRVPGASTVTVSDTATLSTKDFDNGLSFSYYPNPVNNTLTLNAQQAITNVAVFNMLGQEVIRTAPNAVSNEVNMSNLQSGAYFVQVTIGDVMETVKIIKN